MRNRQPKGHGLVLEPILIGEDYVFGSYSKLSGEVINETGDWTPFLPTGELQAPRFETNSCASQATNNAIETLTNFLFGTPINLSDRMTAKGSGTDPRVGNTPKKVADFLRKNWSAPETDWPMDGVQTIDEYYKDLPAHLYDKAQKYRGDLTLGYEFVNPSTANLKEALKRGTVTMSVSLMLDENGFYYKPQGWRDNHLVQLAKIKENGNKIIFDSYEPFIKELRADFQSEFAHRITLNEVQVDWIMLAIKAIKDFLSTFYPQPAPLPAPVPANNLVTALALAHQKHEGGKPGDLNMRLNNPGACRYSSIGYLPKYGTVSEYKTGNEKKGQRGFAHFTSYELGFLYLKNLIIEKAKKHPDWNLVQYVGDEREGWAPASDKNNVDAYAKALANALNTTPKAFKLSQLLA